MKAVGARRQDDTTILHFEPMANALTLGGYFLLLLFQAIDKVT
ncbi:hypothetical protein SAMN05444972_109123 [Marininema halotolerans]|uniref:Uncharacterized protein n=1 Tax=Marininema halotolerans TaxID=1155944 RepID=A0A1I6TAW1_9BACL|nr:hypothetical protein SAMN05444972_109123 [Marininema halotolerans]